MQKTLCKRKTMRPSPHFHKDRPTFMSRYFLLCLLFITAGLLFTGCSSQKEKGPDTPVAASDQPGSSAPDLKPADARPDKDTVLTMRSAALAGMSSEDIRKLKTVISNANLRLERLLIFGDLQDRLSDPDDGVWKYLDHTGEFVIGYAYETDILEKKEQLGLTDEEFDQKYGEPVYATNDYDAEDILRILEELKNSIYNEAFRQNFETLSDLVQKSKDTHDVNSVINIYRILHDMDYYLLRYGPEDVGKYMQDKTTILKYYGVLKDYQRTNFYNENGFL